jgi:acetyl-CoA C-acetyltransferase
MSSQDRDVVIVEAVRTPVGRRNGALSGVHPVDLLARVQRELVERAGVDPAQVGQVIGGCVTQVGEQTFNIARNAWLTAGLPASVGATTIDAQCGSSQQAASLAGALIASGAADLVVACGVESMSRIPLGASARPDLRLGSPIPESYFAQHTYTNQFEAAELIATKWGVSRADADELAVRSQALAAQAWAEDRFATQLVAVEAPVLDGERHPTGETTLVQRDEGLRPTTVESVSGLRPVLEGGVHTAATASQISDGAAAVLLASRAKADELGLTPLARVVDSCLVGVDPVLMLTGPIDATQLLLARNDLTLADIDVVEINEAFASVVLAWASELGSDLEGVNPNGGAIALGHPLGGTGAVLLTKAVHELQRTGGGRALVTMCCGAGLGTGTLLERI